MREQKQITIRYKVTISYLILVILAVAAISVLYRGIHNIVLLDTDNENPNFKLKKINQILTDVYEAEGFSRGYFIFRNDSDLVKYILITDKISRGIDSLKILCSSNSSQVINLNEIDGLLKQKKGILDQLVEINNNILSDDAYSRVIDDVYYNSFENIRQPVIIRGTTNINRDSLFQSENRAGLFNKVKTIFTSTKKLENKQVLKTTVEQVTTYDTIYQPVQFPDSLLKTLRKALARFKFRNDIIKQQSVSRETELLHSDRIILERIRSIVASLETEEFIETSSFLEQSMAIIKQANYSVIVLGALAFVLVFVFLFIIYRDISRTKAYQAELMKARQYSDDLLRLKEQFVATISHEIRTPLSAIIGFSEQLKKVNTNQTQSVCINNIESASKHLHALVNNVLDLSKSNAGKMELENIPFSLKGCVEEIYRTYSNEAGKKGLEFNIHTDDTTDKMILGDKYRFSQVLGNIVNNAIKFTEKGMVDIVAKSLELENNLLLVEVIVFDTGIGIPADKIESIFNEFTQANSDITRKFGGTGLGLSIASKIINQMGGQIQVNSTDGQGSTFIVQVPFKKVSETANWQHEGVEFSLLVKNIKFLVVEDDQTLQKLLEQMFLNNKLTATIVNNGYEAVEVLEKGNFQVVLTDIQMPGMSGIELCNIIGIKYPTLPVIAFSARSPVSENYNDIGFAGYISKPFNEYDFFKAVVDVLDLKVALPDVKIIAEPNDSTKSYSLSKIKEFTGNDSESLYSVVQSFVENTSKEIEIIQNCLKNEDVITISQRVHKLLPMFKQMQITKVLEKMQMIEMYQELQLSKEDVVLFAESFICNATEVLEEIKGDIIFDKA